MENLVESINKSKPFSLIADETSDMSGLEQLTTCVSYTANEDEKYVIKDFIGVVPVTDCTGKALARTAVKLFKKMALIHHIYVIKGMMEQQP